jgi:potassium-dependent mechanosensitive channel
VALGLVAARGFAAQPPPAEAPASDPVAVAVPVPVPEIPRQSERALGRLSEIEASFAPDPVVVDIGARLPAWSRDLAKLRESERQQDPKSSSFRDLEDVAQLRRARRAELDSWQATLEARAQKLQAMLDELQTMERRWTATRKTPSRELPATVARSIEGVLVQRARVDRSGRERLASVLTIQNELASEAALLQEDLERLDAATAAARKSLLVPDAPPLWVAIGEPGQDRGLFQQASDSWREVRSLVRRFLTSDRERFALQLVLFLALIWLLRWLGARGKKWAARPELAASARILSHPVANALLVTLLLTRVFHPRAPLAVYELGRLLLLVPLIRVLPGFVSPRLRLGLYGLAALYVGDLVNALVPVETLLGRVLLILLSGAALTGLVWLARPGGLETKRNEGRWWAAAIVAGRAGALLLAVSIVANVMGLVRLSQVLTDAVLASVYAAAALFAGTVVLEGLLTLVLETSGSRALRSMRARGLRPLVASVRALRAVAVVSWIAVTLGSVQLLTPLVARLRAVLTASLHVGELSVSLGAVLALVVTLWLAVQLSRITQLVLEEDVLPRLDLPRGVPGTVSKLAHYAVLFVGLLFALAAAGIQVSQFALLAGAFGVGIGFGLQNVVNNFVSGLILLFERPIQLGDSVELGKLQGTVARIGIRSSTIRTFDGAEVIVPNARLIDSEVVNWTLSDRLRRIEVGVGVAYGTPPRQVLDILMAVAKAHPRVLTEPAPYALFEGFGDSSLDFILRAWTGNFDLFLQTRSEIRLSVHDALDAAGIVIPFPQRDVHIVSEPATTTPAEEESSS